MSSHHSIEESKQHGKPEVSRGTALGPTLSTFLNISEEAVVLGRFAAYQSYHDKTWESLRHGFPPEADSMDAVTDEHVRIIVKTISDTALVFSCQRPILREALGKNSHFEHHSEDSLNRTIDLALRLWLVLNIRDDEYAPGAHSIQWDDDVSLQTFIGQQFPKPRIIRDLSEKMFDFVLPDNFTMVKLKRYSGIKVYWTYDLSEHLDLDKDHRILKVFPLKYYVNELKRSKVELLPHTVIDEYTKTMNLLFPSWDIKTQKFLRKKGQTFGMEGPVDYPGPLYLSDFHCWRDRLSTLYAEFCSPPPSMTQLFNDRRNVLQWYTFWFAVVILALTIVFGVVSSITACLSTKYTYEALVLAREAAASAQACNCVIPSSPSTA